MQQPTDQSKRPRWLLPLLGCGIAVLCIVVFAGSIGGYLLFNQSVASRFDAERWRQATMGCDSDNPRLDMYSDLQAQLLRERPTRDEVIALLGDEGSAETAGTSDTLSYMLGYNIIDCDSLLIIFDSEGRVSDVRYSQG
ncbi:MAG: hypothetical protein H7Z42_21020 [Roseiflexaceae bacterium]|nr:hypothetical protein [Roseiflexaceae bacterium]